jgi:DNA-binding NtrC family response regulator
MEEANGGTLFLDEIGELELNVQAKFLRVLETQQFTKLGDTKPTTVNVRIVAATNRNLRQEAELGHFRPDLYYRLSVFTVPVPGLNERREDVDELANYFLQFFAAKLRRRLRGLEPEALDQLRRHDWRGNVRELKNVLERAAILADGDTLTTDDLPDEFHHFAPTFTPDEASDRTLRTLEKRQIRLVLQETGGNKMEAARQLGIGTKTLYRKIQEYGL